MESVHIRVTPEVKKELEFLVESTGGKPNAIIAAMITGAANAQKAIDQAEKDRADKAEAIEVKELSNVDITPKKRAGRKRQFE